MISAGNATAYVGGTTHVPLPRATGGYRTAHAPQAPLPTGLDWDAHRAPEPRPVEAADTPASAATRPPRDSPHKSPRRPRQEGRERRARRPSRQPTYDLTEAIRRYQTGETIPALAASLGASPGRLRVALRDAGVQLRDDRATHSGGRNRLRPEDDDPALVERVIAAYAAGQSTTAIGVDLGRSRKYVSDLLRRHKVTLRPPASAGNGRRLRFTDADVDQWARLYAEGLSTGQVAQRYATVGPVVRERLLRRGVVLRDRTTALRLRREGGGQ